MPHMKPPRSPPIAARTTTDAGWDADNGSQGRELAQATASPMIHGIMERNRMPAVNAHLLAQPNGLELSCPAEAGRHTRIVRLAGGQSK